MRYNKSFGDEDMNPVKVNLNTVISINQAKNREGEGADSVTIAIQAIKKFSKGINLGKNLSIRRMFEQGRK
jgi:hypothetical protein